MTSVAQGAVKLHAYGKSIPKTNRDALKLSGSAVGRSIEALARPATGGDLRFSGAGKGTVGTRDRFIGDQTIEVRAVGPMHWLERGVKPHDILPGVRGKRARGLFGIGVDVGPRLSADSVFSSFAASSRGAGVVLKFNGAGRGAGFTRYARNAGGFPALGVWTKGVDAARTPVRGIWRTRHSGALASFFG